MGQFFGPNRRLVGTIGGAGGVVDGVNLVGFGIGRHTIAVGGRGRGLDVKVGMGWGNGLVGVRLVVVGGLEAI